MTLSRRRCAAPALSLLSSELADFFIEEKDSGVRHRKNTHFNHNHACHRPDGFQVQVRVVVVIA